MFCWSYKPIREVTADDPLQDGYMQGYLGSSNPAVTEANYRCRGAIRLMGGRWGGKDMQIKQTTLDVFRIIVRLHMAEDRVVTSREIAEKEGLSQGVLLKILQKMERAGIVLAHQGRGGGGGGFSLEKSVDEITFLEVVKFMEGVDICAKLDATSQQKKQMYLVCSRLNGELETLLSKYTVRDLFESGAIDK